MDTRLAALRRFAVAITVLNLFGHTLLGFEQSPAQPVFSLLTAYSIEVLLEYVQSKADGRRARFLQGGFQDFVDFMLPSHITGLAVAMLLYANDRLVPVIFAAGVAVCSKAIFNVSSGNGGRHFFNPSNFGISITLLLFPSVGITPPYMFTEGLGPIGSIVLPVLIIISGTFLNFKFTHKIPLLASWVSGFIFQAVIRCLGLNDVTLKDGELVVWGVKPEGRSFGVVNRLAINRVHRVPNFQSPFRAS
jgi:hypothetical protein